MSRSRIRFTLSHLARSALLAARQSQGLTQVDLCAKGEIGYTNYIRMESGQPVAAPLNYLLPAYRYLTSHDLWAAPADRLAVEVEIVRLGGQVPASPSAAAGQSVRADMQRQRELSRALHAHRPAIYAEAVSALSEVSALLPADSLIELLRSLAATLRAAESRGARRAAPNAGVDAGAGGGVGADAVDVHTLRVHEPPVQREGYVEQVVRDLEITRNPTPPAATPELSSPEPRSRRLKSKRAG